MKKIVILLLAACIATAAWAETNTFTVTVTTGHLGVSVVPGAEHLRISSPTAGISFKALVKRYGSSGNLLGYEHFPRVLSGTGTQYPSAADTLFTLLDTSVTPWNIYNNVEADSLYFYNDAGESVDVTVEYVR